MVIGFRLYVFLVHVPLCVYFHAVEGGFVVAVVVFFFFFLPDILAMAIFPAFARLPVFFHRLRSPLFIRCQFHFTYGDEILC